MWHLRNQPLGISLFRLAEGRGGPEILMRSEEVQIGKRVRVRLSTNALCGALSPVEDGGC
jgi:hypothetical protein